MFSKKKIKQVGQSLIEVIIALVIAGIILVSLVRVVVIALRNVEFSKNKNFSLHLAQTKVEQIRKDRDSLIWEEFVAKKSQYEATETLDEVGGVDLNGKFTRKTTFDVDDKDDKVYIKVVVSWTDSKGEHSTTVNSTLTRWK